MNTKNSFWKGLVWACEFGTFARRLVEIKIPFGKLEANEGYAFFGRPGAHCLSWNGVAGNLRLAFDHIGDRCAFGMSFITLDRLFGLKKRKAR